MKTIILFFLLLNSLTALAKMQGSFRVAVWDPQSKKETLWEEMKTATSDWSCETFLKTNYDEYMANHQGVKKRYNQSESTTRASSFFSNPHMASVLYRDLSIKTPLNLSLSTKCTNSKTQNGVIKSMDLIEYEWQCDTKKLPQAKEQSFMIDCSYPIVKSTSLKIDIFLTQRLNEKKLKAKIKLLDIQETFTHDLCKEADLKNRKIIKFTQGLQGSFAEDDFTLTVYIEGHKNPLKIRSQTGIFKDEIATCRKDDLIKLFVSAKEEDPIWDDHFQVVKGSSATVYLSTTLPEKQTAKIHFIRDNSWDRTFTDYKQQVKLEIRNSPIYKK